MHIEILTLPPKILIGLRQETTMAQPRTSELWQQFMPRRGEIQQPVDQSFYSVQVYPGGLDLATFNAHTVFEQWAAVQVMAENEVQVPGGMEAFPLPGGTYLRALHRGPVSQFPQTLAYIFEQWLPGSAYTLDARPHFQRMDERYRGGNQPDSEEQVYVPVVERVKVASK